MFVRAGRTPVRIGEVPLARGTSGGGVPARGPFPAGLPGRVHRHGGWHDRIGGRGQIARGLAKVCARATWVGGRIRAGTCRRRSNAEPHSRGRLATHASTCAIRNRSSFGGSLPGTATPSATFRSLAGDFSDRSSMAASWPVLMMCSVRAAVTTPYRFDRPKLRSGRRVPE